MNISNISTLVLLLSPAIIVARVVLPAHEAEYVDDNDDAEGNVGQSYPLVMGLGGASSLSMVKPKRYDRWGYGFGSDGYLYDFVKKRSQEKKSRYYPWGFGSDG